jgi:hypothetical protein
MKILLGKWLAIMVLGLMSVGGHAQLVINEILINATSANCDGSCTPNTGEWTELYNNSNSPINIGCYVLTDGDWSATIPPGTILQPYEVYTVGSVNSQIPNLDLNIATCNCTSGAASQIGVFTNGDEQVVIASPNGTIVDGLYWGAGQFSVTPSFTTDPLFGCASATITLSASNPSIQQVTGTVAEAESIFILCDGTGNLQNSNNIPTPGQPNFSSIQTIDPNENITPISCGGSGSIQLNPISGVGPYNFQWQGTLSSNSTDNATIATAGNYTVMVTDIGQCGVQQSFTFNVTSTSTTSISLAAVDATLCEGESTNIIATGGGNYVWFPASGLNVTTGDVVTAQPTTTATYTVSSNFNGCVATETITIDVLPLPTGAITTNSPQCEGSDVVFNLTSNNTTNVDWTGPNGYMSSSNSPTLSNIGLSQAGTYVATLYNGTCSSIITTNFVVDSPVTSSIDAAGPFCAGDPTYDLNSPDEPGQWSGAGISDVNQGIFDPTTANSGSNTITFQSDNYCTSPATLNITIINSGDANITPIGVLCDNSSPINLIAATSGGAWTGSGVNALGQVNPITLNPGNYTAIYTLPGACGDVDQINFTIEALPQPSFTWSDSSGCAPLQVTFNTNSGVNSNQWLFDGVAIAPTTNQFSYTFSETHCTDVTLVQTSPNGCNASVTENSAICAQETASASFVWSPEEPSITSPVVTFTNLSENFTLSSWNVDGNIYNQNSLLYTTPSNDSLLLVCLTVDNSMGCRDSLCRAIHIKNEFSFFIPNGFTPNDDGFNDGFGPVIFGLNMDEVIYTFAIFSRDGEQIFETHDPLLKWNGDKDMGNYYVLQDSYIWQIELVIAGLEDPLKYRGHVIMLR